MSAPSETPNTPLGRKYPGAGDCCHSSPHLGSGCDTPELYWPEGIAATSERRGSIQFRYRCEHGHVWTCWWDRAWAEGRIGF